MVSKISDFEKDLMSTLSLDFHELSSYNIQKVDKTEFTDVDLDNLAKEYLSNSKFLLLSLLDKNYNVKLANELIRVENLDKNKLGYFYIQEIIQIVFFRLCHFESKKTLNPDNRNLIGTYLKYLTTLIKQKFYYSDYNGIVYCVSDTLSIHILGSYMLNYSRSLTDPNAKFVSDFEEDYKKCINNITERFTFIVGDIDKIIELNQQKFSFVKDALVFLTDGINKKLLDDRFASFYEDVNLPKDVDTQKFFKELRITVVSKDIGVLGLVDGKDGIVLNVYHLLSCTDKFKKTRLIIQILHEFGHYLISANSEFLIANTPRRSSNLKCQSYEAGYLLEYYVFSYEYDIIKKQYWTIEDVQDYILNLSNWNNTKNDFSKKIDSIISKHFINNRGSNFNDSGMEIDLEKSVKE